MIRLDNIRETQAYATLRYFFINGILFTAMYFGWYEGVEGAQNIVLTLAWIISILGIIVLLAFMADERKMVDMVAAEMEKKGHPKFGTPMWFDVALDIVIVVFFVWYGHQVLAAFYALHIFGTVKIRTAKQMSTFNALKYGVKDDE